MDRKHPGECQALAKILERKRAAGLVDIKFLLANTDETALDEVCAELVGLYQAVEGGAFEPLRFNDSHIKKAA